MGTMSRSQSIPAAKSVAEPASHCRVAQLAKNIHRANYATRCGTGCFMFVGTHRVANRMKERTVLMKSHICKTLCLGAAVVAMLLPAAAQDTSSTTTTTAPTPKPATINQRKENQQDRIAQGVKSGQLTAGETGSLQKSESNLNKEEHLMRTEDNGKLTSADRSALTQQQNQLSSKIYQDKHNAAVQNTYPTSEVGKRAENQQDRIAQGVKSGQLTAGETANLEKKEAGVNQEVSADRKANGGKLTQAEKAQVNKQQNKLSNQIYKDKHNSFRQKP